MLKQGIFQPSGNYILFIPIFSATACTEYFTHVFIIADRPSFLIVVTLICSNICRHVTSYAAVFADLLEAEEIAIYRQILFVTMFLAQIHPRARLPELFTIWARRMVDVCGDRRVLRGSCSIRCHKFFFDKLVLQVSKLYVTGMALSTILGVDR